MPTRCRCPLILYDVPSRTGVTIAPETYAELAKHPNINGVKEASGNFCNIQRTRNLCPEDFFIWSGNDDETAAICLLGGKGVISVAANVAAGADAPPDGAVPRGATSAAGRLQLELKELCDALFCEVNPIPVKTALNLMGWDVGDAAAAAVRARRGAAGPDSIRPGAVRPGAAGVTDKEPPGMLPGGSPSLFFFQAVRRAAMVSA